ncbi:hypothetical protein [Streptomyces sp. NPDC101393]|uniref:hypothetical protein n=1 Tax=Streptomyces sp. NPDC101393 TaxID=3366141 RepID=UPI00380C1AC2
MGALRPEPVLDGRAWRDGECEGAGFVPRTAVRTQHSSTAVRMAAAGVGVLFTSSHELTGLDCVHVPADPPWRRSVTVFSRVQLSRAAGEFARPLREVAGRDQEADGTGSG